MRYAIIGDIHSNLPALKSVLADIDENNVDSILCTGDLVGYAPFPNEVIDLLRRNHILSIQGNYDEAIGNRKLICGCDYTDEKQLEMAGLSVRFTNEAIRPDNREYLRMLPQEFILKTGDLSARMVHGSPRRMNEYLYEDSPEAEQITRVMAEDILICGHTHIPYHREINSKHLINTGSIGKPKHGNPHATYGILNVVDGKINFSIREVRYDVEITAKAIEANGILPNEFADMLRKG